MRLNPWLPIKEKDKQHVITHIHATLSYNISCLTWCFTAHESSFRLWIPSKWRSGMESLHWELRKLDFWLVLRLSFKWRGCSKQLPSTALHIQLRTFIRVHILRMDRLRVCISFSWLKAHRLSINEETFSDVFLFTALWVQHQSDVYRQWAHHEKVT